MNELSRLTGAAEGTIFYHFKNKEEIFVSVLEAAKDRIDLALEKVDGCRETATGLDQAVAAVSTYLNLCGHMRDEFLMLHRHFPYEISTGNHQCQELLESIYTGFLNLFENALIQGKRDGSVSVRSTRKTAMVLYAMVDGIARLETYNIYSSGALYHELVKLSRHMLTKSDP
jgi:AcrR family transcriptional regulator